MPGFPDLTTFAEAPHETFYAHNMPRQQGFNFAAPDGLKCGNNGYPDVHFEALTCFGPRPEKGPGLWEFKVDARNSGPATVEQLPDSPDYAEADLPPRPALPAGQKITAPKGVSVCGVTADGATACRLGEHGFLLTRTTSTLF